METALVTGASRGLGRGIAISLADSGFKVFATSRTIGAADLPEAIIRIACDHTNDEQTACAFAKLQEETGRLDVLVNSAWGGYERMLENGNFTWPLPFWQQPMHRWTSMMDAGVHAAFTCSSMAASVMVPQRRGLIVNISYWAAQKYIGNVIYGISKAATDKMTSDMAVELRSHNVTVISLYPGLVRTEAVMQAARSGFLDITNSESPEFSGRVIAALARERNQLHRTGKPLVAADLARGFDICDTDGRQPASLTLQSA